LPKAYTMGVCGPQLGHGWADRADLLWGFKYIYVSDTAKSSAIYVHVKPLNHLSKLWNPLGNPPLHMGV